MTIYLPEASSTMRVLSSARCTGVRLYTLQIKIGTNQRERSASSRIVELTSGVILCRNVLYNHSSMRSTPI